MSLFVYLVCIYIFFLMKIHYPSYKRYDQQYLYFWKNLKRERLAQIPAKSHISLNFISLVLSD